MLLRPISLLTAVLATFSLAIVAAEKPKPSLRLDLRPFNYRLDPQLADRTRLGFLSDSLIVVNIDQKPLLVPVPGENRPGQASPGGPSSLPPIETVVFDLETKKPVARGRLGGNRLARNFAPTHDGKFVVRTYTDLRLFGANLAVLATYPLPPGPTWADFQVTPSGRRIVVPDGDWILMLDADSLERIQEIPAARHYAMVFSDTARLDLGLKPGTDDAVYLRFPGRPAKLLFQTPDSSSISVEFLTDDHVYVERDASAVVLSTEGKQLYALKLRGEVHRVHACLGGQGFALESWGVTLAGRLLHPFDRSGRRVDREFVEVFDTSTGRKVFEMEWSPRRYVSDVALSPDGHRLAVVRGGFLEIYDLPPVAKP